ncbi:DNA-binding transcriptional regulator [Lysinibacillus sp. PLM2]|nr:DNA-binding transcriptional regulator [Lysinibacillus sp. PLM2]
MSKAKRLNELIMMVNRKKRFTVGELAQEFGVSKRTILRDMQDLSEMGVPLYSETGPHGGYQVLNERILPPIAFSEHEAISIFFAIHALRHYISLPFETEYESIKKKFYLNLSGDVRDRIDKMINRVDFYSIYQKDEIPFLKQLLEASIEQIVINIHYEASDKSTNRSIQPIGIYARDGKWYCPAYDFLRMDYRVFRCDRIKQVKYDDKTQPINLEKINLNNRFTLINKEKKTYQLYVEFTSKGIEKFNHFSWPNSELKLRENGTGFLKSEISEGDLHYFAEYFINYGTEALVKSPVELIECIKMKLNTILRQY